MHIPHGIELNCPSTVQNMVLGGMDVCFWCPTAEEIMLLEGIGRCVRCPSADQNMGLGAWMDAFNAPLVNRTWGGVRGQRWICLVPLC